MLPYRHTCASADSSKPRPSCSAPSSSRASSPIPTSSIQQRRPARHQRRPLEHLGGVVGRARADHRSASAVPRQHLLSAHQRARVLRRQHRRGRRSARRSWLLTKNPYTTHNFVFLFAFAQSFVATYYLVRHLTGDRRAAVVAGIMYAYCPFAFVRQAHIQLLMIGFLPWCDAGLAPLPRSHHRSRARSSSAW